MKIYDSAFLRFTNVQINSDKVYLIFLIKQDSDMILITAYGKYGKKLKISRKLGAWSTYAKLYGSKLRKGYEDRQPLSYFDMLRIDDLEPSDVDPNGELTFLFGQISSDQKKVVAAKKEDYSQFIDEEREFDLDDDDYLLDLM